MSAPSQLGSGRNVYTLLPPSPRSPVDWFRAQFSDPSEHYNLSRLEVIRRHVRERLEQIDPQLVGKERFIRSGAQCRDGLLDLAMRLFYTLKKIFFHQAVRTWQARDRLLVNVTREVEVFRQRAPTAPSLPAQSQPPPLEDVRAETRVEEPPAPEASLDAEIIFQTLIRENLHEEIGDILFARLFQGRLQQMITTSNLNEYRFLLSQEARGTMSAFENTQESGLPGMFVSIINSLVPGAVLSIPQNLQFTFLDNGELFFHQGSRIKIEKSTFLKNLEAYLVSLSRLDSTALQAKISLPSGVFGFIPDALLRRYGLGIEGDDPAHRGNRIFSFPATLWAFTHFFPVLAWHRQSASSGPSS